MSDKDVENVSNAIVIRMSETLDKKLEHHKTDDHVPILKRIARMEKAWIFSGLVLIGVLWKATTYLLTHGGAPGT